MKIVLIVVLSLMTLGDIIVEKDVRPEQHRRRGAPLVSYLMMWWYWWKVTLKTAKEPRKAFQAINVVIVIVLHAAVRVVRMLLLPRLLLLIVFLRAIIFIFVLYTGRIIFYQAGGLYTEIWITFKLIDLIIMNIDIKILTPGDLNLAFGVVLYGLSSYV
jgi:hypothetical protein